MHLIFLDYNEPRSITMNSTNSVEQMCSNHISQQVNLQWHILENNIKGKASVKGITLSQGMMDIVRMSPLNWGKFSQVCILISVFSQINLIHNL